MFIIIMSFCDLEIKYVVLILSIDTIELGESFVGLLLDIQTNFPKHFPLHDRNIGI